MNANQTQTPFIVTVDGEVDKKLSTLPGNDPIAEARKKVRKQLEMLVYDMFHGTNYRQIHNQLMREKRNRSFEARIGLIAVKK